MDIRQKEVAEAVVTQLNAHNDFVMAFKAKRSYRPIYDLKQDSELEVNVICLEEEEEVMDRGFTSEFQFVVDIGVQYKFPRKTTDAEELEHTDKLVQLCQEIGDHLRDNENDTLPGLAYRQKRTAAPFSPELLDRRQFTGVIEIRYDYDDTV